MDIAFPICIKDGDDITYFNSVYEAEISMEAIDVVNNTYKVFDKNENVLNLIIINEKKSDIFGLLSYSVELVKIDIWGISALLQEIKKSLPTATSIEF